MKREGKYKLMSEQYTITHSNIVLRRILETFTIQEILTYEKDMDVLYQLVKSNPEYIIMANSIPDANGTLAEDILNNLLEEYKINVGITDTVLEFFNVIRLDDHRNLEFVLIDLINTAIKNMNEQGFEVVAYNLSHSDIRKMISTFLEPMDYLSMKECIHIISKLMTRDNYTFIIEELERVLNKDDHNRFEEYIMLLSYAMNLIKDMPEPEDNIEDEDFNPLTEPEKLSVDELYNIGFNYINCDINIMDRMDAFTFIHNIKNMMLGSVNANDSKDTLYMVVERLLRGLYSSINKAYTALDEDEPKAIDITRVIEYIEHIDFRLPRIKYLLDGRFDIKRPLYEINLQNEYNCLKDLKIIEQLYEEWYNARVELGLVTEPNNLTFGVDLTNMRKILPFEETDCAIM